MKITVKHVAEKVGCSLSLVYFYLNHPETTRVAEATRKKIDQAVKELNYQPNLLASILKNGSGRVIGVMIDTEAADMIKKILSAVEQEVSARGFYLQVGMFHDNLKSFCSSYTLLKQFGAQGVICLSHDYPQFNEELKSFFRESQDIVFYNGPLLDAHSSLEFDFEDGIAHLWHHLQKKGKNRLALCLLDGTTGSFAIQQRIVCYQKAVQKEALPICYFDPALPLRQNFSEKLLAYCKKNRPQAILFQNDRTALSAMQFLQAQGIKIPEQLSIIGFDNDKMGENATPSLTTLAIDIPLAAKQMTDLLFEQLHHKENPHQHLRLSPQLLLRESCR